MAHSVTGASLTPIYERLNGVANYHPLDAETFSDWATEAGDIVTVTRDGKDYSSPIHTSSFTWRGRAPLMAINTTGNQKRDPVSKISRRKYGSGGAALRGNQALYYEMTSEDGLLHSALMMTSSELRTEFQSANSTIYSAISQTAGEIRSEVGNVESGLRSTISQTAGQIRSEVSSAESDIYSAINQTSNNIMIEVGKSARVYHQYSDPALGETVAEKSIWIKDAGVQTHGKAESFTYGELGSFRLADFYGSEIYVRKSGEWVKVGGDQLAEYAHARLEVDENRISIITDGMSGDYAEFVVELGRIRSKVEDVESGLQSTIEQTASMIRSAVWTANSEMYSEIIQTQSMIRTEVGDAESNLRSEFTQTAAGLNAKIGNKSRVFKYDRSPVRHADARALLAQMVNDGELGYGDLWVYDPTIRTHGEAAQKTYGNLASNTYADFYGCEIFQVIGADSVRKVGGDQLDQYVSADLDITKEHFNYTTGSLAGRCASLEVSRDQIRASVVDLRRDLGSEIVQTASEIRTAVWSANSQIYSTISQTATQIRTEVTNQTASLQSSITQNADKISLVVQGTGTNAAIKAAQIVASINNGGSSVLIAANHVKIDGNVNLSDAMSVDGNGYILMKKYTFFSQQALFNGGISLFDGSAAYGMTGATLASTIKSASVSGSTLTLTNYAGSTINFSKATTLNASWSGSVLSIKAQQTNGGTTTDVATNTIGLGGSNYGTHTIDLAMTQNGTPTIVSGSDVLIPVKIVQKQGGGATTDRANTNLQYSLASLLTTGSYSTAGTKTPGSGYIGFSSVTFTIPNASGFTRNSTSYNTSGSNQVGSISKSGLTANSYIYWTVGGKKFHIVVNA